MPQRSNREARSVSRMTIPERIHETVARAAASLNPAEFSEIGYSAAYNEHTAPETLRLLAACPHGPVRRGVAKHANTPEDVLAELARDHDRDVRQGVVYRANERRPIPPAVLALMITDEDTGIRKDIAYLETAPPELLTTLWEASVGTRHAAVVGEALVKRRRGTQTPQPLVLAVLRHHPQWLNRATYTDRPATPEVLDLAARHGDKWARVNAAEHENTAVETLVRLAADPDNDVRARLSQRANLPDEVARILLSTRYNLAAFHTAIAKGVEWVLAQNDDRLTQIAARCFCEANASELAKAGRAALIAHPSPAVRAIIAKHHPVTARLRALIDDPDPKVRATVASRARALDMLETLAVDADRKVRRAVAANRATPADLLATLAADEAAVVRLAVAKNPNADARALALLVGDDATSVRAQSGERFLDAFSGGTLI